MFKFVRNVVRSFVHTAAMAQQLDDAVSYADGKAELVSNLEAELVECYRRIDNYRHEQSLAENTFRKMNADRDAITDEIDALKSDLEVYKDDNAALRKSLAAMRAERDELKDNLTIAKADNIALTSRPRDTSIDPFDGGCAADR